MRAASDPLAPKGKLCEACKYAVQQIQFAVSKPNVETDMINALEATICEPLSAQEAAKVLCKSRARGIPVLKSTLQVKGYRNSSAKKYSASRELEGFQCKKALC